MDKLLNIDITSTPFSVRGAYLSLLYRDELGIYTATQRDIDSQVYGVRFIVGGKQIRPTITATPAEVTARYGNAVCRICIQDDYLLAIDSCGMDLMLYPTRYRDRDGIYGIQYSDGHFVTTCFGYYYGVAYLYTGKGEYVSTPRIPRCGKYHRRTDAVCLHVVCEGGKAQLLLNISEEQVQLNKIGFDYDAARDRTIADWQSFLTRIPDVTEDKRTFAELSWYTLWSCIVTRSKYFPVDAVLMSMVGMTAVWSWDHCFIALATAHFDLQLGLNQFLLPFNIQCSNGALPDCFGYNCRTIYGVTKPPIHGWCFGKIMDMYPNISDEILRDVYSKLLLQLRWWLTYRDADGDGIPDYPQGCDSGLDNSTVFAKVGKYVESPDLPAYLLLQYNTLLRIAERVGYDTAALAAERDSFFALYLRHSLVDGELRSLKSGTHAYNADAHSVIDCLPLVLGDMLPKAVRDTLIAKLRRELLTDCGIASEAPTSRYYRRDGYWRGPIWAPTTYIVIDGLRRAGETALADDITARYMQTVISRAQGNYENFEALSGRGLRIKGHTWTAAISLLLLTPQDK